MSIRRMFKMLMLTGQGMPWISVITEDVEVPTFPLPMTPWVGGSVTRVTPVIPSDLSLVTKGDARFAGKVDRRAVMTASESVFCGDKI